LGVIDEMLIKEVGMKRLIGLASLVILLCFLASCDYHQKQREVRTGLDASVNRLPELVGFETITISYGQSSMKTCHYAEAVIMLGTAFPEEDALETYVDELQSSGWMLSARQHEREKVLTRDAQERIVVSGFPSWKDKADEDYIQAKSIYPTVIFVSLWFYVPQRDGC
jgi:hypothetical protein